MQLLCPKCHSLMNRYERNDVAVDQCTGCGGLFLDRGELEHLIQAEAAYYAAPGAVTPPRPAPSDPRDGRDDRYDDRRDDRDRRDGRDDRYDDRRYDDRDGRRDDRDPRSRRKKKARGFLEDLLDL